MRVLVSGGLLGAATAATKLAEMGDVHALLMADRRMLTDAHITELCRDKSITELDLTGCAGISKRKIESLGESLPDCEVVF